MMNDFSVIKPSRGWRVVDIREILRYKDLLYFLTTRNIKSMYAQSILGVGWAVFPPLFNTILFTVIFGKLAKIGSDGIPYVLFSFSAMVPCTYFTNIFSTSANSLVSNKNLLTKVYFPRLILPLSAVFTKLVDFTIGLFLLAGFMIYFRFSPNINFVYFPLLLSILIVNALGLGLIVGAMSVQFRDINHMLPFLSQFFIYSAPITYPISKIPDSYQFLYGFNPLVGIIEGFRVILLGIKPMPWTLVFQSGFVSIFLLTFGVLYFRRMETIFADVA